MPEQKRINFDIPVALVPQVRMLADMDGQNVRYWLRKVLEQAVNERLTKNAS